jgi:hypothetical protein
MLLGDGEGAGDGLGDGLALGVGVGLVWFVPAVVDVDGAGLVADEVVADGAGVVVCVAGVEVVADGVGVGDDESLGEAMSLELAPPPESSIAAVRTVEVGGGEPQTELAVAVAELAAKVATISSAAPKEPSPMATNSAIGLASSALTRAPSLQSACPTWPERRIVLRHLFVTLLAVCAASVCVA